MKRGFTLVELLAVIIIIGVVALIAVPSVMSNISESKRKLYDIQVQDIELGAKKWATDYSSELDSEYLNSSFVSVEMLKDLGYIAKEKIQNPNTGEEMNGCVEVAYDLSTKTYSYTYDDTDCNQKKDNGIKGFYYTQNLDNTWSFDSEAESKESIFSYLVGKDNANVVVTGPGLYDMGDKYVFRGNVTNNYVLLNGANYRILSLDKNTKSLKLISETNSAGQWGTASDISFNASKLYEGLNKEENTSQYESIINNNVKWNIGKIDNINNLNLNAIKTYEEKTKIVSKVGIISMSEYMEASINLDCANGVLSSCGIATDTYLAMPGSWTTTTTLNSVAYIDSTGGISYETDLLNSVYNVYPVINVVTKERIEGRTGTASNRFKISVTES